MPEGIEPRTCRKCTHYSPAHGRCLRGVINPRTIKGGLEAVQWFGVDYICKYSRHYDKIKLQHVLRITQCVTE